MFSFKTVLFACAGCLRTATIDWPRWYEGHMTFKTVPLSVHLREKIRNGEVEWKTPIDIRAAYHDPCHNRRHLMDGRNAAGSSVKVADVVELMAQAMGLDTTIPENPYTKYQEQDVIDSSAVVAGQAPQAAKKAMAAVEAK
jgi:hypothetical protein